MMDQSVTRRGQPCWYRVEGVNYIAINDSFMLEGAIYFLLKKHFRQDPAYISLVEIFNEVRCMSLVAWNLLNIMPQTTFQTEIGQLLDLITAPEDSVDLSKFSLEK